MERKYSAGSHVFDHMTFLYKPINYSVACSLYGVTCWDTVNKGQTINERGRFRSLFVFLDNAAFAILVSFLGDAASHFFLSLLPDPPNH